MPRRRVVVALAALGLVSAFTTSVAHATQNPWPWPIICTQAAFTSYGADQVDGEFVIHLSGSIQPCPGVADPGARRSFTLYGDSGATLSPHVRPILDPQTQSYTFDASGSLGVFDAVCLIDGLYLKSKNGTVTGVPIKRACVSVDRNGTGAVVTPIPTSDPRETWSTAER